MNKKDFKLHEKAWVTPKIQKVIKYRDKLLWKLNRKFTEAGEYLYKKFRNRVVNELKSSRISYYNSYFTEHKSNMKMLWNGIKSIINIKGKKICNISQLVQNGEAVKDPCKIAKIFDNYFVNIAAGLIRKSQGQRDLLLTILARGWICLFLFLLQILLK